MPSISQPLNVLGRTTEEKGFTPLRCAWHLRRCTSPYTAQSQTCPHTRTCNQSSAKRPADSVIDWQREGSYRATVD